MKFVINEASLPLSGKNKEFYSKNNTIRKLKELNPGANINALRSLSPDTLTVGQTYKVLWRCPYCGEDYIQEIRSREKSNKDSSCPDCMESGTSDSERAICTYLKATIDANKDNPRLKHAQLVRRVKRMLPNKNKELDMLITGIDGNNKWAIEYDGAYWHREDSLPKDIRKDELCAEANLNLIRLREKGCPKYDALPNITLLDIDKMKPRETCENILQIILGDISDLKLPKFDDEDFVKYTKNKEGLFTAVAEDSLEVKNPRIAKRYDAAILGRTHLNRVPVEMVYADCNNRFAWFKCKTCGEIFLCKPKAAQQWDGKDCNFHGDKLITVINVPDENMQQFLGNVIHKNDLVDKINSSLDEAKRIKDPSKYGIEYRDATKEEIDLYNKDYVEYYKQKVKDYLT